MTNNFNTLTICAKKHHDRCSTGLWMCLRLKVLSVWGVGGLQVHGTCSRRLLYSEEAEAQSNYKKPYFWWFRNLACGDSTGSNRIEKGRVGVPPRLVWGKGGGGIMWFNVCEPPLNDWANDGSVDVFFMHGEYGFSSMGIWGQNYVALLLKRTWY